MVHLLIKRRYEAASSPVIDVDRYIVITKLLGSILAKF
jgi:hypothetical protein